MPRRCRFRRCPTCRPRRSHPGASREAAGRSSRSSISRSRRSRSTSTPSRAREGFRLAGVSVGKTTNAGGTMRIRTTLLTTLALLALAGPTLVACGSDDDNDSGSSGSSYSGGSNAKTTETTGGATSGGEKLTLDAVEQGPGQFSFSKKALTANAGNVTVAMTNPTGNQEPHAIEIEGQGVEKSGQTVTAGGTSTVTADLKPGRYEFYCPVDDHRADGMEGTLTVK